MLDKETTLTQKLFLTLFALGGTVWLGATVARTIIGFDAFEPGTLAFKSAHSEVVRLHTIWLFTLLGGWTGWAFACATIGGMSNVFALRHKARKNGWIVMCAMMYVLMLPVQAYLSWQDFHLFQLFDFRSGAPLAQPQEIIETFLFRYTNVGVNVATGLLFLMGISMVMILAFRPLVTNPANEN